MKNLTTLTFSFFLIISLIACGSPEKPKKAISNPNNKTKTVTTTSSSSNTKKEDTAQNNTTQTKPTPPEHLETAKEIIASISSSDIEAVDAETKYKMFCAACHGFTGDLNVNGAKDLTISKVSLVESVAQVYYGKGLMNAHKDLMEKSEIVAVAKYIETLRK